MGGFCNGGDSGRAPKLPTWVASRIWGGGKQKQVLYLSRTCWLNFYISLEYNPFLKK